MADPRKVGLVYDEKMCLHRNPDLEEYHPENPNRIRAIWNTLQASPKNILQRCVVYEAKEAEDKHIYLAHSKNHVKMIKSISSKQFDSKRQRLSFKFNSIYFNEGSSQSAYLAAGSVLHVAEKVANGELNSAMAIVRPPGHHAEWDEPMGFCLFNNVAVATKYILDERPDLGVEKILIVDWDVHHGNGTQKAFWKDPRVLFFSVHRHENGCFYPANDEGYYTMIGEGSGAGYNINVPWENGRCGDSDYLAAWDHVLLPVAEKFDPDMIIVSAGFDAAVGDPLGGCRVTPKGYSDMLKKLMKFANGKVVLALEGGYNLESIANSSLACVEALLEEEEEKEEDNESLKTYPFESTWRVIKAVRKELSPFWPTLAKELPAELTNQITPNVPFAPSSSSDSDTDDRAESINFEEALQEIIKPLSSLKVDEGIGSSSGTWRSELSKIVVWYASFGSNMWLPRFLCYIQGGQVEGMRKICRGAEDKTAPKEIGWKISPSRLFFGRERSSTWGEGGVAFVDPKVETQEKTYMCLYKITLEQFNDVLLQENGLSASITSPLFDQTDLSSFTSNESNSKEVDIERCWYPNVVYLGKQSDVPILTMTCSSSDAKHFKSGELPLRAPAEKYVDTLVRGLVEGKQLSEPEARDYIQQAYTRPLF